MQLIYVIKGYCLDGVPQRWAVTEEMLGEISDPENMEALLLDRANALAEKVEANGCFITAKEYGMLWDDRLGFDVMGIWGTPINSLEMKADKRVFPDEKLC